MLMGLISISLLASYVLYIKSSAGNKIIFTYTVQTGDDCIKIATGLKVSVKSIITVNGLDKDCRDIYPGQILSIPYPTPTQYGIPKFTPTQITVGCKINKYIVREGDTLENIADGYKVSQKSILFYNGLRSKNIHVGTELVIPLCNITPPQ